MSSLSGSVTSLPAVSEPPVPGGRERMVALVDCESFYASCERVFNPALNGKPIVVLSNNDGCVVALNREAKQAGVKMGTPWFQISAWATRAGVIAQSSNYELYGALSARVMEIIGRFSAWQEVYSVDESFIGLNGTVEELVAVGREIRATVLRYTGIPVRVAIGRTKTLAKLAALGAKADLSLDGVCHLGSYSPEHLDHITQSIPVSDLWGVGGKLTKRLAGLNIQTVADLRSSDLRYMRKKFSVNIARTIQELNGVPCIPLENESPRDHKDQLIFSRSFSTPVRGEAAMRQVLSVYAQRVSGRLREQGLTAGIVSAWCATAYYKDGYESVNASVGLPTPTSDPIRLSKASYALLHRIRPDAAYVRAGVILTGLRAETSDIPLSLFESEYEGRQVGETLDSITKRFGSKAIGVGVGGLRSAPSWNMKRELLSRRTLTMWDELAEVKA